MNQHTFGNIGVTAQIYPAKPARFIGVCERTLQPLTTLAEQPSASRSANPSSITLDSIARRVLAFPVPAATRRLG
jgi:hypothetical protein